MIARILNTLDKKYAFGILTGLIFGLLGVYTDFFKTSNPEIKFDILNNTTVIDLKENIKKIDIFYDSSSIISNDHTLSLITLKISNSGSTDILKSSYDENFPLGFKVSQGDILENPTLIQSSSTYLNQSVKLNSIGNKEVNFSSFIFEKNEFFIIKLLVLHKIGIKPQILAKGKVAGIKNLIVSKSYLFKEEKSFWKKLIEGSFFIHISRFLFYVILFIIIFVLSVFPLVIITEIIDTMKRKKEIKSFTNILNRNLLSSEISINNFYISNGFYPLESLLTLFNEYGKYKWLFDYDEEHFKRLHYYAFIDRETDLSLMKLIKVLREKQYIRIENEKVLINDDYIKYLTLLIDFLASKND